MQLDFQQFKDDIVSEVISGIRDVISKDFGSDDDSKTYLTCKEVESLLNISGVTRWKYTNDGIIKSYKIGSRLRYRKDEVLNALQSMESEIR
ncbi:helix-turn-helix domain-containing protein [Saprospiraceae bacterium]|nr:helix-turn-helix domain-containing protein [Saprospiraceae bacterium]